MSHLPPGLIGAYNSLTDKHLTGYFNNARIRRHLQRVGLISRSGRIVSEKEFRYRIIHKDQQRHVRECLAQAIFHRVLDMERLHQTEIRRKLEECVRRERVNKVKVERCNRYEDDPLIFLSPRPPTRLRNSHARHSGPEREPSDSTDSLDSSRPNTAPEETQRPLRLKPLNSNGTPTSTKRNLSRSQEHVSTNDEKQQICSVLDGDVMRHLTLTDFSSSVSPYRLPVINNFVTPVPPLKRRNKMQNGTLRGRRLRPTTAPSDGPISKEGAVQRAWSQTAVWVKMVYFGKSVHLSHDLMELKDEVKVFQQHCGGENLCVYKGRLKEGESFQFMSRRHRGFPFSLTFYLNGLQVERLSSCCEFKHKKNSRLGGRHAHFGFSGVEGAAPCYRCIIAMGLDKKPAPPNRIRNNLLVSKSWEKEDEEEKPLQSESSQSHLTDPKRNSDQERKHKNGYEEDFEADDEGPMDDGVDKGNETTFNREVENERRTDANGLEDSNRNQVRGSSSVSSSLTSSSSSSEEGEGEFDEEQKEEELRSKRHTPTSTSEKDGEETDVLQTCSVSLPTEDKTQNQEIEHTERDDGEAREDKEPGNAPGEDDKPRDRPGETEEAEEPGKEPEKAEEPKEVEQAREEPEETEDPREEHEEAEKSKGDFREEMAEEINEHGDRVKSVQAKLAEAILNMHECVSEPELSDTTTEEDEMVLVVTQRAGPDAESENNAAQQTPVEENGAELVQAVANEEEYTEEPKEETATHKTSQAETKIEEEENDTKQEEKTHSTANEDEHADDEQSLENKGHNTKVRQGATADEEGQIQQDDNFSTLQSKSNVEPENTEEPPDEELRDGYPPGDELRDGVRPVDELRDEDPPDDELPNGDPPVDELLDGETPDEKPPDEELPNGDPPVEKMPDGETLDEKPPDEELPNGDPPVEELLNGEQPDKEPLKKAPTEKSVNAEESRATSVENTKESSKNHGNVDQNTEIENVNEEELGGGEEVSVEEISDNEKIFVEESGNLRNSSDETNIDTTEYVEGSMEDPALNEVKDENLVGEDKKSEERMLSETVEEKEQIEDGEGNETDMRNAIEVIRDQDQVKEDENTEKGNRDEQKINHGTTEDLADQNEPTPTGQISNKKAENEVRKSEELEEGFTAENDAGLQEEQELGSEGKNTEEDKHKEELEKNKSFKEYEIRENEWHMSEGEEVVGEADVEMQGPLKEQQENHGEQIHGSDPSLHEALQETIDGPEVKSGELTAENGKEDQGELDKEEGPGEGEGTFESSEEINQDMDEEAGVKAEQMDEDNEQVDQKEIHQEITNEEEKQEEEEEEVGVKGNEQKQTVEKAEAEERANLEQETISEREIEDKQKEEVDNFKPFISESRNDTANEHEASSDAKTPVEDPAGADSEPKDTIAEFEGRTEDESKASPGSNIQSPTDIKKVKIKNADAAEESRRLEGSISPSEKSQPLDKVLAVKRDEREPELIVAPRINHEELVNNWVIVHQASKYFETFVEPLDEIKINDGERSINTEALEVDEMMQSPKDSEEKEESSEAAKVEQIILPVNGELEHLQETTVENSNMEAEALGAEGEHNQSFGNPSKETEDQRKMNSELTPEDQECVKLNNVIDISATSVMKIEISQDS